MPGKKQLREQWDEMQIAFASCNNKVAGTHVREQLGHDAFAAGVRADNTHALQTNA